MRPRVLTTTNVFTVATVYALAMYALALALK